MKILISGYNSQVIRVIQYVREQGISLCRTHIERGTGISKYSLKHIIILLVHIGIFQEKRINGRNGTKLYGYNKDFDNIFDFKDLTPNPKSYKTKEEKQND